MKLKGWALLSLSLSLSRVVSRRPRLSVFSRSLRKPIIFIIAVLLIFGTFFSTLTFIPAPKKAYAVGNTYYVRADGTAVDKTTAVGPSSDVSKTMNMPTYNSQTFSPGDTVYFSGLGGSYTTTTSLGGYVASMHIVSSGEAGNTITYEGIEGDIPLIDMSGDVSVNGSYGMLTRNKENVVIRGFQIKGGGGALFGGAMVVNGSSGSSGAGYSVQVYNIDVLENFAGDCFDVGSATDDTPQVEYWNITASKCREASAPFTGSHQCISNHEYAKSKIHTMTCTDSNYFYVGTKATQTELDNVTVSGILLYVLAAPGSLIDGYSALVENSNITVDAGSKLLTSSAGSSITASTTIRDSSISITNGAGSLCSSGIVNLFNNNITVNSSGFYEQAYGGTINFAGNNVNLIESAYFLYAADDGGNVNGKINIYNNLFTADDSYAKRVGRWITDGTGSDTGYIKNNIFYNFDSATQPFWIIDNAVPPQIYNNTFYNNSRAGGAVKLDFTGDETVSMNFQNNIFYNIDDPINIAAGGASKVNISHNDYYNSNNEGGTGSMTSDPQFVNPGTDFNLQSTSPAIDAGYDTSITTDYAGKQRYDDPDVVNTGSGAVPYYDIGAYEYVTPPSPSITSSSHPSQTSWYNNSTPIIVVNPTSSTTSYKYLVNQTAVPAKADVEVGTASASGSFTVGAGVINADGVWYVHMIGENLDGDFSTNYSSYTINYDATAPTASMTPSPLNPNGSNGWYITEPSIELLATDLVSGINAILYHWDTGSVYAYGTPITAPEGTHTLYYYSVNNAGDVSVTGSQVFKTSLTAPNFSNLPGNDQPINLVNGQVITEDLFIIKILPTDTSGIEKVEFSVDDNLLCTETTADSDGVYSCAWDTTKYHSDVKVVAYDYAGNSSTLTRTVIVAAQLPETGRR